MKLIKRLCGLFGHKWENRGFGERWHETHRDQEGRPQGCLATFRHQICYRCTINTITRRQVFVHLGPMTEDEQSTAREMVGE